MMMGDKEGLKRFSLNEQQLVEATGVTAENLVVVSLKPLINLVRWLVGENISANLINFERNQPHPKLV